MILRMAPLFLLALLLASCFSSRSIRPDGLKHVRLGGEMPSVERLTFHGYPLYDTLYDEGGYQWRAVILEYPKGKVYVEEDFFGGQQVNRIRIETPELRYQRRIGVGSTVADLRELEMRWSVVHLPPYGRIDISSGPLHFLISDSGIDPTFLRDPLHAMEALPGAARIVAIVVM